MIDIRKLKELVRLMVDNDLSELDLQDQQETVTIKRGAPMVMAAAGAPIVHHTTVAAPASSAAASSAHADSDAHASDAPTASAPKAAAPSAGKPAAAAPIDTTGLVPVSSPMVGTVYLAPNPESPSFVQAGASVGPDSTVCLIEAMKVFSEIKAETSGVIERVLVSNGQSVEYGQALFLVRPA